MATTTNYSWTTPDDTGLVKDGASAIRSLGTSVDTTTKNLNPSTTLGDIEYRSSTANTNTRLGIGSTGNVLTVAGGVPTWAAPAAGGGLTLLSTTTLSGNSTTISSISGSYKSLILILKNVAVNVDGYIEIKPNDSSSNTFAYKTGGSATWTLTDGAIIPHGNFNNDGTAANLNMTLEISNYAASDAFKSLHFYGYYLDANQNNQAIFGGGGYRSNTAISSLVILGNSSNTLTGTALVYGVN